MLDLEIVGTILTGLQTVQKALAIWERDDKKAPRDVIEKQATLLMSMGEVVQELKFCFELQVMVREFEDMSAESFAFRLESAKNKKQRQDLVWDMHRYFDRRLRYGVGWYLARKRAKSFTSSKEVSEKEIPLTIQEAVERVSTAYTDLITAVDGVKNQYEQSWLGEQMPGTVPSKRAVAAALVELERRFRQIGDLAEQLMSHFFEIIAYVHEEMRKVAA